MSYLASPKLAVLSQLPLHSVACPSRPNRTLAQSRLTGDRCPDLRSPKPIVPQGSLSRTATTGTLRAPACGVPLEDSGPLAADSGAAAEQCASRPLTRRSMIRVKDATAGPRQYSPVAHHGSPGSESQETGARAVLPSGRAVIRSQLLSAQR